ncbi:metal-sulfur cluster assembly factor [Lacticaseibacillus daqingensis]|uniref:metal-sulfur cluster assembly factor n=1 Tax=Lacticaseibacillus daqingensis TaxID=2486014 RepID=UPI001CDCA860|nr:metal-sulfur cluster assembly factor [Lacticaseibacillus daqingensis]
MGDAMSEFTDRALTCLEQVIDPELGVDLVNLGLIYDLALSDSGICTVTMTLTTMGCPLTGYLNEAIDTALSRLPEVRTVNIELVWTPKWTTERMSRGAKLMLGLH